MARISEFRSLMRHNREARRALLTRGERILGWTLGFVPPIFALAGVVILANGGAKALGIVLLLVALVVALVPTSAILRARVRRRGEGARGEESLEPPAAGSRDGS